MVICHWSFRNSVTGEGVLVDVQDADQFSRGVLSDRFDG